MQKTIKYKYLTVIFCIFLLSCSKGEEGFYLVLYNNDLSSNEVFKNGYIHSKTKTKKLVNPKIKDVIIFSISEKMRKNKWILQINLEAEKTPEVWVPVYNFNNKIYKFNVQKNLAGETTSIKLTNTVTRPEMDMIAKDIKERYKLKSNILISGNDVTK